MHVTIGIPQPSAGNTNLTNIIDRETRVFCARYNITTAEGCEGVLERVNTRVLAPERDGLFTRRILLSLPIDAPDSRKLPLVIREGKCAID